MQAKDIKKIAAAINAGQVGVMPTDTIYGVVGRADTPAVVERIYQAKGRDYNKPFVVLVSKIEDLKQLKIELRTVQEQTLNKIWPAPVSVILLCPDSSMVYLTRGLQSLAVRLPDQPWLQQLLELTGPLVATSANKSGQPPSSDLDSIKKQLPDLDFYIEGSVGKTPSKLVRLLCDGTLEWLERATAK